MSKFTWLKYVITAGLLLLAVTPDSAASAQVEWKKVFIRGMSREGKRVFFATETANLGIIRRFEVSRSPRIRLYFPRPPFGKLEQRSVSLKRFMDLIMRKDKKQPQPTTLKTPFVITLRGQKITAIDQRLE